MIGLGYLAGGRQETSRRQGSGLEFKAHAAMMRHASRKRRWHPLAAPVIMDGRITAFVPCLLSISSLDRLNRRVTEAMVPASAPASATRRFKRTSLEMLKKHGTNAVIRLSLLPGAANGCHRRLREVCRIIAAWALNSRPDPTLPQYLLQTLRRSTLQRRGKRPVRRPST